MTQLYKHTKILNHSLVWRICERTGLLDKLVWTCLIMSMSKVWKSRLCSKIHRNKPIAPKSLTSHRLKTLRTKKKIRICLKLITPLIMHQVWKKASKMARKTCTKGSVDTTQAIKRHPLRPTSHPESTSLCAFASSHRATITKSWKEKAVEVVAVVESAKEEVVQSHRHHQISKKCWPLKSLARLACQFGANLTPLRKCFF